MNKTAKDVLDDHLSLCVLAYARLTARHNGRGCTEKRKDDTMTLAIQAASLFTVSTMNALGDRGCNARALDLTRELFREMEDVPSIGKACTASLGLLSDTLFRREDAQGGGAASEKDGSATDTACARVTSFRRKRGKTPPFP
ncbi:MAG: hypothetical protein JW885_11955 [Deltaproteobacteria bacterium]|nr:hypothetical protein [Candidatus Zymogenaceae bacterium]